MERFVTNYSYKNIPIPSKKQYKTQLISKVEKVIKSKALEFLGKLNSNNTETYGFQSIRCPPAVEELWNFENYLLLMIRNIEFRKINNSFEERLSNDIKQIKNSDKVFVSADKSRHIYKLGQSKYKKLLKENITKTYKMPDRLKVNHVNSHAKRITEKLPISDRTEKCKKQKRI